MYSLFTSSNSTPHSFARSRMESDMPMSPAMITSLPESMKSKIPATSTDPPKSAQIALQSQYKFSCLPYVKFFTCLYWEKTMMLSPLI